MAEDITSQFNGLKNLSILLVLIIIGFDIYVFYYPYISESLRSELLNRFAHGIIKVGLLKNPFYPKVTVLLLTVLFVLFDKGKKSIEADKTMTGLYTVASAFLFLSLSVLQKLTNSSILYASAILISYFLLVSKLTQYRRLFGENIMKDRFNQVNKIFPQMTEEIHNDLSINIPYKFVKEYKENKGKLTPVLQDGYINILSPNRAVLVTGMPGSGKTYSFNEEIIRQHIAKGFAMINYDFKFPTLTNITYNYFNTYRENYSHHDNGGRFRVINIDDPRYSHRCNPIRSDLITKKSEAIDAVYTLYYNIDKKSATKQDFFQMSAMAITGGAMWFLKMYEGGRYLSLPHLIEFIQQSDEKILPILSSYPELTTFVSAFADALAKNAFEQLAGQTASARIPLGKLATDEMYYVMTDPDMTGVNLRVNLPEEVTVLNIANNPETQKTNAPALGLFMSQAAKLINAQNRIPCTFHVDELPTIFINGLDTLIATARSNKVCTVLSAQDYTQLVREYGRETADSIFNTIATKITGQVAIDTAEKYTKAIGKINYKQQSISINKDDTSTSFSTQREFVVPAEDISQFSQGEFAGIVADTFKEGLEYKAFRGYVSPDKSSLNDDEFQMINPDLTQRELKKNTKKIQQDIENILTLELARISGEKKVDALVESDNNSDNKYIYGSDPDLISQEKEDDSDVDTSGGGPVKQINSKDQAVTSEFIDKVTTVSEIHINDDYYEEKEQLQLEKDNDTSSLYEESVGSSDQDIFMQMINESKAQDLNKISDMFDENHATINSDLVSPSNEDQEVLDYVKKLPNQEKSRKQ